jgi:hypothetical protein
MIITAYCGKNFRKCLELTSNSWGFCRNLIFTDTNDFGIQLFDCETADFKESCKRRIFCLQKTLKENIGEDILLLDVDIMIISSPIEVFQNPFDLALTRVINRKNSIYEDANIGVVFCKSNNKTIEMCERWIDTTDKYAQNENLGNPDQTALTDLALLGYDGLIDLKVTNFSENIYNFERNDIKSWTNGIIKYKPKIIHLKNGMWKNEYCINWIKNYVEK